MLKFLQALFKSLQVCIFFYQIENLEGVSKFIYLVIYVRVDLCLQIYQISIHRGNALALIFAFAAQGDLVQEMQQGIEI